MIDGLVFLIIATILLCIVDFKLTGEIAYLKRSRKKIYNKLNDLENEVYDLKKEGFYEQRNKIYGANSCRFNKRETRVRK